VSHHILLALFAGQFVSRVGDAVCRFGLTWIVYDRTGSSLAAAGLLVTTALPGLLFGMVGGAFADRYQKRDLMVVCDLARGAIIFVLAVLIWQGQFALEIILPLVFLNSCLERFFEPALLSLIPALVPQDRLVTVNSIMRGLTQVCEIAGPLLGGLLVVVFGGVAVFAVDSVSFVWSAVLIVLFIPRVAIKAPSERPSPILAQVREGLAYIVKTKTVLFIVSTAAVVNFIMGPVTVALPIYARDTLGGVVAFSLIAAGWGGGSILGAVVAPALARRTAQVSLVGLGVGGLGLSILTAGVLPFTGVAVASFVLAGISVSVAQVAIISHLQSVVAPNVLGRVFGAFGFLATSLMPLGYVCGGLVLNWTTCPAMFSAIGVLVISIALATVPVAAALKAGEKEKQLPA